MKTADIRYRLPQGLYDRLEKVATDKGIAMRDVLIRILDDSLPLINTPLIESATPAKRGRPVSASNTTKPTRSYPVRCYLKRLWREEPEIGWMPAKWDGSRVVFDDDRYSEFSPVNRDGYKASLHAIQASLSMGVGCSLEDAQEMFPDLFVADYSPPLSIEEKDYCNG